MSDEALNDDDILETPGSSTTPVEPDDDTEDTPVDTPVDEPSDDDPVDPPDEPLPPIELVVETGNCLDNANSYVDLDFADKYNAERARTSWSALDDEQKKRLLILGTDYIDHYYKWHGYKSTSRQALSFPRVRLIDADGFIVNGIPLNLKKAVVEAAYLNISNETLYETKSENGNIKREKLDVIETEYFEKKNTVDYSSIYTILNSLLNGLYITGYEQTTVNVGAIWLK